MNFVRNTETFHPQYQASSCGSHKSCLHKLLRLVVMETGPCIRHIVGKEKVWDQAGIYQSNINLKWMFQLSVEIRLKTYDHTIYKTHWVFTRCEISQNWSIHLWLRHTLTRD